MKVYLLNIAENLHNNGNEKIADVSAALCIDRYDEAWQNGKDHINLTAAVNSGHLSVIEHLPLTFYIKDVSRACTHQLVRHRIASYSQLSQRYAKVDTGEDWFVIPECIRKDEEYSVEYVDLMERIAELYNEMCQDGIPEEDARMILPNACFTSIVMSMNARAFIEACTKRVCNKAQWEIRELFKRMRECIKDAYPTVYRLSGPECSKRFGCKESKPCGKTEYCSG